MDWSTVWAGVGASLIAVLSSAAFTLWFSWRSEREHKRGVRALVAHEVLHNLSVLRVTQENLRSCINAADPTQNSPALSPVSFVMMPTPTWQHTRWDLPDVGVAFKAKDLEDLAAWYSALADFLGIYESSTAVMKLPPAGIEPKPELGPVSSEDADLLVGGLKMLLKMVSNLIEGAPEFAKWMDSKVERENPTKTAKWGDWGRAIPD